MANIDVKKALTELNKELKAVGVSDIIYTLGGAALYLLGYEDRATVDVDDLRAVMTGSIFECAKRVAKTLGIDEFWLNTGAAPLVKNFEKGWKSKCQLVFSDTHLKVYAVDRQTLINTKLAAACNRSESDTDDLKWLKPNKQEMQKAKKYVQNVEKDVPAVVIDANIDEVLSG